MLYVVFSFNRGQYLNNCVESMRRHLPTESIVVFDDNSDDPTTLSVIDDIRQQGISVISSNVPKDDVKHGGLRHQMNLALQHAGELGLEFVTFVQDDMQLMWFDDQSERAAVDLLKRQVDASQVTVAFHCVLGGGHRSPLDGALGYAHDNLSICDTGIMHVDRLRARGFEFVQSERESSDRAAALGLRSYGVHAPYFAWVPWPTFARARTMAGRQRRLAEPPMLRPFSAEDVARLRSRRLTDEPFHEDYCVPWGWRCWTPFNFQDSYRIWMRDLAHKAVRHRSRRLVPGRSGVESALPAGLPRS